MEIHIFNTKNMKLKFMIRKAGLKMTVFSFNNSMVDKK